MREPAGDGWVHRKQGRGERWPPVKMRQEVPLGNVKRLSELNNASVGTKEQCRGRIAGVAQVFSRFHCQRHRVKGQLAVLVENLCLVIALRNGEISLGGTCCSG